MTHSSFFSKMSQDSSIPYVHLDFSETLSKKFGDDSLSLKWMLLALALHFREGHLRMPADPGFWRKRFHDWFSEAEADAMRPSFEAMLSEREALVQNNPRLFGSAGDWKPLLRVGDFFYLQKTLSLERRFNAALKTFQDASVPPLPSPLQDSILQKTFDHWTHSASFPLSALQREAVRLCLQKKILLVTGGPGTGKTTLLINLLRALVYAHPAQHPDLSVRILLAAPTGKAASGMAENLQSYSKSNAQLSDEQKSIDALLPVKGMTLHRVLNEVNYLHKRYGFPKKISADIIALDETSMADAALLTDFFEALPPQARLILIGDKNQLPSVESGSMFADLIPQKQDKIHRLRENVVSLTEAKRSVEDISNLASAVLDGDGDSVMRQLSSLASDSLRPMPEDPRHGPGVLWWNQDGADWSQALSEQISKHFSKLRDAAQNFSPESAADAFKHLKVFKILCAVQEGRTGVQRMNELCRKILWKNSETLFPGMPIMISKNDPAKNLWNGEQGLLANLKDKGLRALFPQGEECREFAPASLKEYSPSFAMTIHKSQGAEFDTVLLLLPEEVIPLLTREILYTGITRAKICLIVVAKKTVLDHALKNSLRRDSGIRDFLMEPDSISKNI